MSAVETIISEVARIRGVPVGDIVSKRRQIATIRPRQEVMYLARHLTSFSLPTIGRAIGGRDHTTVLHGIRTIEAAIATTVGYGDELETLQAVVAEALPSEVVEDALAKAEGRPSASEKAQASIEARIVALAQLVGEMAGRFSALQEDVRGKVDGFAHQIGAIKERGDPSLAFEERMQSVQSALRRLETHGGNARPITLQLPCDVPGAKPAAPAAAPAPAILKGSPKLMAAVRHSVAAYERLENDEFSPGERHARTALERSLKDLKATLKAEGTIR